MKKPRKKGFDSSPVEPGLSGSFIERNSLAAPEDIGSLATDSIALQALELLAREGAAGKMAADESGDALSLYLRGVRRTELFTPSKNSKPPPVPAPVTLQPARA